MGRAMGPASDIDLDSCVKNLSRTSRFAPVRDTVSSASRIVPLELALSSNSTVGSGRSKVTIYLGSKLVSGSLGITSGERG